MTSMEPSPKDTEQSKTEKSPARKKLELLESTGEYLFHGSPAAGIEEFEPRQAMTGYRATKEMHNDGSPGIAATATVDTAVFRSIVHKANLPEDSPFSSSFDDDGETRVYRVDKATIQSLKVIRPTGHVYVFRKSDFHPYSGAEWRSEEPVTPIDTVDVNLGDLPLYETTND